MSRLRRHDDGGHRFPVARDVQRVVDINALRALAPPSQLPVPRPSRRPPWIRRHSTACDTAKEWGLKKCKRGQVALTPLPSQPCPASHSTACDTAKEWGLKKCKRGQVALTPLPSQPCPASHSPACRAKPSLAQPRLARPSHALPALPRYQLPDIWSTGTHRPLCRVCETRRRKVRDGPVDNQHRGLIRFLIRPVLRVHALFSLREFEDSPTHLSE